MNTVSTSDSGSPQSECLSDWSYLYITKKKNLGLAGTQVPNPLAPNEKKKVYSTFFISYRNYLH